MKFFVLIAALLVGTLASSQLAGTNIRCSGLNKSGNKIGIDVSLDTVDRIETITTFENDATSKVEISELGAPSHFLKVDRHGRLLMFGFKSFNDGLEEVMSVSFAQGASSLSRLQIGYGDNNNALKSITCKVLK